MPLLILGCAMVGLIAARSIVAESDAHRRTEGDRWWAPGCEVCGRSLNATMLRCVPDRHPQRGSNLLVIIATVVLFAAIAATVPSLWVLPAYLSFGFFVVVLTITDIDTKLIPNRILLPATIGGSALLVLGAIPATMVSLVVGAIGGAVAYFLVMLALALVARGALGMGDVKLAFYLGMFTGFLGWGFVVIAGLGGFLLGGAISILLLITRRVGRKDAIPFGPFMTTAAVIAVVFGSAIIDWYTR
jgi:leader peptidase (prepilin peptidase) / N-methyltransferase